MTPILAQFGRPETPVPDRPACPQGVPWPVRTSSEADTGSVHDQPAGPESSPRAFASSKTTVPSPASKAAASPSTGGSGFRGRCPTRPELARPRLPAYETSGEPRTVAPKVVGRQDLLR
jgi:hypothetical protein